jgi:hypothetical protein
MATGTHVQKHFTVVINTVILQNKSIVPAISTLNLYFYARLTTQILESHK